MKLSSKIPTQDQESETATSNNADINGLDTDENEGNFNILTYQLTLLGYREYSIDYGMRLSLGTKFMD